jgi:hypothetical protein
MNEQNQPIENSTEKQSVVTGMSRIKIFVGLGVLQDNKPLSNALNTIRAVGVLTREKGQEPDTFDLFGFDDSALKEAEAMARIASRKQRQIAKQVKGIRFLAFFAC